MKPDTFIGTATLPETGSMNTEVIFGPSQDTAEFSNPDTALTFIKQLVSQQTVFTVTYVPKRSNQ